MEIKIDQPEQFRWDLTLYAQLTDAPDIPVNTWTKKIMLPERLTAHYHGPIDLMMQGRGTGRSSVRVTGRRRLKDGGLGAEEEASFWSDPPEWLAPAIAQLDGQAAKILADRLR